MTNSERVLAYLENEMSAVERTAFEQDIVANQELGYELAFQKEIIEGIKAARKAELKAMLNQVPVGGPSWSGSATQWIAGAVALGVISITAIMLWPENETKSDITESNKAITENIIPEEEQVTEDVPAREETTTEEVQPQTEVQKPAQTTTKRKSTNVKPLINIPEPIAEIDQTETDEISSPASETTITENESASMSVQIINDNKKFSFHYQFIEGNLLLFGEFETTYEILDFIKDEKRAIYLYYQDSYYSLINNSDKIRALDKIENKEIIAMLDRHRLSKQ